MPDDAFVFGSIRRFVKEKGLDVAIESLAEVRRRSERDVRLVLIGEGPEETALANAARRLGVAEWVLFPGFNSSPWNAYPAFDAFVMPSRIEALGVVVLEAMASGCFVIGSNVGGIPEMIPDSSIGMLVQPDNARALADAMHEVLSWGYEERFAAAARARQYVIEHYEMRHHYLKIAALLE